VTVLAAARVLTGDGGMSASPAFVVIEEGRVVATGTGSPPGGGIDLGDALLAPGFVDLQVNGLGTVDFATADPAAVTGTLDELTRRGVTSCLPTLVSAPLDAYAPALDRLREAGVWGVHLEGPFLGGAPGAHTPAYLRRADVPWLAHLLETYGELIRVVTLAPESDPELRATRELVRRGVRVALGHSTASYEEARAAAAAGASLVTHVFNGMGALHHRAPGLAGAALTERRLVPSLIADFVHVHPAVVRLVVAARPDALVVSDAVGGVAEVDGAARLPDGTLAGAIATLDAGVRNLASLGVTAQQAVRMATGNPTKAIGATDRGRLAPGCRADVVALDPETLAVRAVWVNGRPVGPHGS